MLALELAPNDAETIRWVVALVIPLLVGLLTKSAASSALKATVSVVIAAANTAVMTWLDSGGTNTGEVIRDFIQTAVISFAMYAGLWRPTGVAGKVADSTAGFGVGAAPAGE